MKYIRKPTVVEAWQVDLSDDTTTKQLPPAWIVDALKDGRVYTQKDDLNKVTHLVVQTNHGPVRADTGDWIINGADLYPVQAKLFDELYQPLPHRTAPSYTILDDAVEGFEGKEGHLADRLHAALNKAYGTAIMTVAEHLSGPQDEKAQDALAQAFGFEDGKSEAVAAAHRRKGQKPT